MASQEGFTKRQRITDQHKIFCKPSLKTLEDMDFDPTVFEINEADVFALEDENLTYENSFDMT